MKPAASQRFRRFARVRRFWDSSSHIRRLQQLQKRAFEKGKTYVLGCCIPYFGDMKSALPLLVLVFTQCSMDKFKHPVAIIQRAEVRQDGQPTPVGIVELGDSIDFIDYTYRPADSTALVQLRNGKRGYIPVSALEVPDWYK